MILCCELNPRVRCAFGNVLFFYRTQVRSLFTLVTDSVTHWRLVNLIDVTLACADGNSKLVDVDDEDRVGNSLLQIWKLRFGHKAYFLFRLWALWSRFWSSSSGEILKLKFGQYFAADAWLRLRSWIFVNILKLGLVKILTLDLVEKLMFGWDFEVNT